jgi:hypothetical protein
MKRAAPLDRPWYRQPLVWLLIAIPLAGIAMATITATMAYRHADAEITTTAQPLSKTSWRGHAEP